MSVCVPTFSYCNKTVFPVSIDEVTLQTVLSMLVSKHFNRKSDTHGQGAVSFSMALSASGIPRDDFLIRSYLINTCGGYHLQTA